MLHGRGGPGPPRPDATSKLSEHCCGDCYRAGPIVKLQYLWRRVGFRLAVLAQPRRSWCGGAFRNLRGGDRLRLPSEVAVERTSNPFSPSARQELGAPGSQGIPINACLRALAFGLNSPYVPARHWRAQAQLPIQVCPPLAPL